MIKSNNQVMLSAEVQHSYYKDNICTCLQFTPVNQTAGLLNRFGIITRSNLNGFELFVSPGAAGLPALMRYMVKAANQPVLEYQITSTDPYFLLFTELPFGQPGQLVYDTGSANNRFEKECLQLGEQIIKQPGAGLGTLIVSLDDLLRYGDSSGFTRMRIDFMARSTQWQYYVINRSSVQLDNPAVTAKNRDGFEGPTNVTIATGQQALLFSSGTRLLPLCEEPGYSYDLVNTAGKSIAAKVIYKGLPTPDPARIGAVTMNGEGRISSPMYVYI
jgi:hypothetical protein